ncbi:MAG: endonuclease/exonuclease/phosphatase family protein [Verrucomicrobiota bacterium]
MNGEFRLLFAAPMRPRLKSLFQLKIRFWELLSTGGFLICLFSVAAFTGKYWWLLDLTSHFRFQYALLLSTLSLLFFIIALHSREGASESGQIPSPKRRVRNQKTASAVTFTLFALLNWSVVVPQCWLGSKPSDLHGTKLGVMLLNVQKSNEKTDLAIRCIHENDPDLVLVEEVDDHWWSALSTLQTNYPFSLRDVRDDNFGIALFSKFPLQNGKVIYFGGAEVPSLAAQIQLNGNSINFLGTHPVPPAGAWGTRFRNEHLADVSEYTRQLSGPSIILGDLNTTPWNHGFKDLLKNSGLLDTSRGLGYQPTWPSFFWPMRIPLDHCLVSSNLTVSQRRVGESVGSDHLPIIVDLVLTTNQPSKTGR